MHMRLEHLRERLLREGVAHRHVRRYVTELADHYDDAFAEEQAKGLSHDAAAMSASSRLGDLEELAMSALSRPELRSVYARFSPAIFGAGPLLAWLGLVYATLATIILTRMLVGTSGPLSPSAIGLFQGVCFVCVRVLPVAVGTGMVALALRHRVAIAWPLIGAVFIAMAAGTSEIFITPPTNGGLTELEAGNALLSLFMPNDIGVPEALWLRPSYAIPLLNIVLILTPLGLWRRRSMA